MQQTPKIANWPDSFGSMQAYNRAFYAPPDAIAKQPTAGKGPFHSFTANGMPCIRPPWGQLIAVNANTGEILWKSVLGLRLNMPEGKQLLGNSGSAGPTVTAGGLVFVGATSDGRFRAFDAKTGKQLWESRTDGQPLTATGNSGNANANPMTYTSKSGKQFVGIVAGGNLRVFALPQRHLDVALFAGPGRRHLVMHRVALPQPAHHLPEPVAGVFDLQLFAAGPADNVVDAADAEPADRRHHPLPPHEREPGHDHAGEDGVGFPEFRDGALVLLQSHVVGDHQNDATPIARRLRAEMTGGIGSAALNLYVRPWRPRQHAGPDSRIDGREIAREVGHQRRVNVERHDRGAVTGTQHVERQPGDVRHLAHRRHHAAARVEQQHEVKRLFPMAEIEDLLRAPVVRDAEIVLRQAIHHAAAIADIGVDAHDTDARAEGRLVLRREEKQDRRSQEEQFHVVTEIAGDAV